LQLLFRGSDDCNHAIALLESTPSLSSLNIELKYDDVPPFRIFSPLRRGRRGLRPLRMQNVCLIPGSSTISELVNLEELEELQLIGCDGYDCLVRDIKNLPLRLKSFCINESDETNELFESVENDFLRSLKPLTRLSLTLGSDFRFHFSLLDWSALQAHASALKNLRMEYTWPEIPFSSFQSGFAQFCKAALSLKTLAISGVAVGNGDDDIVQFLVGFYMDTVSTNPRTNSIVDMHRCPTLAESTRAHCRHERAQRCWVSSRYSFPKTRDSACSQERESHQETRGQDLFFACGQLP
jgi:hypothetical protein